MFSQTAQYTCSSYCMQYQMDLIMSFSIFFGDIHIEVETTLMLLYFFMVAQHL